jgi:hypothetical protein
MICRSRRIGLGHRGLLLGKFCLSSSLPLGLFLHPSPISCSFPLFETLLPGFFFCGILLEYMVSNADTAIDTVSTYLRLSHPFIHESLFYRVARIGVWMWLLWPQFRWCDHGASAQRLALEVVICAFVLVDGVLIALTARACDCRRELVLDLWCCRACKVVEVKGS